MNMIFLDHAGNAQTSPEVININNNLCKNINKYNNPHTTINNTQDEINKTKDIIIDLCGYNNSSHACIFTSGSTNACKLLSETLNKNYTFNYLFDNHNSVLGIAAQFDNKRYVETINESVLLSPGIFAYPAESNFNGKIYPLFLKKHNECYTILDASKYLSTNSFKNLKNCNADFIFFTFYKITGLPQGLGVLLVKRSAINILNKTYFGGGTLEHIIPSTLIYKPRVFDYFYEDGSLPYLNILIAQKAIMYISPLISKNHDKIIDLTNYTINTLKDLGYAVYSDTNNGSIITFNHNTIGHKTIETICKSNNIIIRTGCFCNPGACVKALNLNEDDLNHFVNNGRTCYNDLDIIDGKHTGACRISVGLFTTKKEVDILLNILRNFSTLEMIKGTKTLIKKEQISIETNNTIKLVDIYIYPIQSLNGIKINKSEIDNNGLLYDKMYVIKNKYNKLMTVKNYPQISKLKLMNNNGSFIIINKKNNEQINVNSEKINYWLSETLNVECKLEKEQKTISFSNTSQYVIINQQSMYDLNYRILLNYWYFKPIAYIISLFYWVINYDRFRPSLVIDAPPYLEDNIDNFTINNIIFNKDMLCTRYSLTKINNNNDNTFLEEPINTLIKYRNNNGKVNFGVLYSAKYNKENNFLYNNSILSKVNHC